MVVICVCVRLGCSSEEESDSVGLSLATGSTLFGGSTRHGAAVTVLRRGERRDGETDESRWAGVDDVRRRVRERVQGRSIESSSDEVASASSNENASDLADDGVSAVNGEGLSGLSSLSEGAPGLRARG